MATQVYFFPPLPAGGGANPSVGVNGSPIPSDSTLVAGENPSGNLQPLQTDSSGYLYVSLASEPLTPLNTSDAADGPVTPGTVASKSILIGLQYNSALPTLSSGQQAAAQSDSSGRLILSPLTNSSVVKAQVQDNAGNGISSTGGALNVNISSSSPTLSANLTEVGGAAIALGQTTMSASLPVAIASDQSAVPISAASLPLPTGAATAANQTNASQKTQIVDGSGNVIASTSNALNVNISGSSGGTVSTNLAEVGGALIALGQVTGAGSLPVVIASDQSAVPVSQSGTWNINNISGTVSLPTGASTAANQSTIISDLGTISGQLPATLGQKASAASLAVVVASDQSPIPVTSSSSGTASANAPVYNVYSSTNITTSAYTQLVASTSNVINNIHIFDSSGQAMILATGAAGLEVDQLYVPPGGDTYSLHIPAGTRIAYKALTANATAGYLLMSFLE